MTREDPPPPVLSLLLDEGVLFRQVGSPEVMREQLEYLMKATTIENIQLQVVPINGEHLGQHGGFTLATLPDLSEVVYVENAARGFTMAEQEDIAAITKALIEVRAHALPVSMSIDLIGRTVQERWT